MSYRFEKSGSLKPMTAEELAAADAHSYVVVCYHDTDDEGATYWLYLAVKPSKYKEFMRLIDEHKPVKFRDYGDILRFGFDKEVPSDVKQEMKELYGCREDYMEFLAQDVKKARTAFLTDYEAKENKRIGDIVAMLKQKPQ